MRNMSKKTWKLRVWNRMTEIQKLDYLLTKTARQVMKMWRCRNAAKSR